MDNDELKTLWAKRNRELEASMRLNTALLQQWNLRAVDTSLKRLTRGLTLELILNLGAIVLIGAFVAAHVREPQFLIPAIALEIYAIALVVALGRQLAEIGALDYDEPVVAIQKRLEALRVRRIRSTLATLLFAPLMWVPLLVVGARGFFGLDVYAAGPLWLTANLLFGLAVIPIAVAFANRYGARIAQHTAMRGLADTVAGRSLAAALDSLDSIRRFEREG